SAAVTQKPVKVRSHSSGWRRSKARILARVRWMWAVRGSGEVLGCAVGVSRSGVTGAGVAGRSAVGSRVMGRSSPGNGGACVGLAEVIRWEGVVPRYYGGGHER